MDAEVSIAEAGGRRVGSGMKAMILVARRRGQLWSGNTQLIKLADGGRDWLEMEWISAHQNA
jgi:hypothetical protein